MERIDIPEWIKPLASSFEAAGHNLYLVGGYVRNAILDLPFSDIDVCSSALPEQAMEIAEQAGFKYADRNVKLGTIDIILGEHKLEYTPFRVESYTEGGSHRPESVIFTDDMSLDAMRRDFRINAIYVNAYTGEIADPLGGLGDIQGCVLTACRQNPEETLKDDGLRLLRMARFAAQLGFYIDPGLFKAAKACSGNIKDISKERIAQELRQICLADTKYGVPRAHYRAMRILDAAGVLGIIYPELMEGKGLGQSSAFHAYDVFNHNMHSFEAAPPNLKMRLAGLLHDVAKPHQYKVNKGKMYGHDNVGAVMAREMLERTGIDKDTTRDVCQLIERHMFDLDGSAKLKTCRKKFAKWGFAFTRDLIQMRITDIEGSGKPPSPWGTPEKWEKILNDMLREGAIDNYADMQIDGADIMKATGLTEGEAIGRIKKQLFERIALNPAINNRGVLINEAKHLAESMRHNR